VHLLTEMQDLQTANWVWSLMGFVLLVGFIVMMTLQTIKDLFPWRTWFQSGWMYRWLEKGLKRFNALRELPPFSPAQDSHAYDGWTDPFKAFDENVKARTTRNTDLGDEPGIEYLNRDRRIFRRAPTIESDWDIVEIALQDLADLATAGSKKALLGLPIEQLCGQMNTAMQLALEHPEHHVALIVCLSHLNDQMDLGLILQPISELTKEVADDEVQKQKEKVAAYSAARQRLAHHIQRAVDGFQISIANRWKFVLQISSILLGIFSVFGVLYFQPNVTIRGNILDTIVTCLVVGTVAGFAASVLRDIFSLLDVVKK
jgi:hypothetical protein